MRKLALVAAALLSLSSLLAIAATASAAGAIIRDTVSSEPCETRRRTSTGQHRSRETGPSDPQSPVERVADNGAPRVSVIVATRDRPEMLARCVRTILENDHDDFELIIVDQSLVDAAVLPSDQRLRHIRSGGVGKSAALNLGVRAAHGLVLAFTDDDCTVPREWLNHADSLLERHPEVKMAFGNLVAVEHDSTRYFVPETLWSDFRIVHGPQLAFVRGGAGANLVVRRELFDALGEWDESIGPGSRFKACEEWDLYYRALASGAAVALDPELVTVHWGSRSYADGAGRSLRRAYAYGEGAVIGKHLRLADLGMAALAGHIVAHDLRTMAGNPRHGRRPGIRTFGWRCLGMVAGIVRRVDRERRVFRA